MFECDTRFPTWTPFPESVHFLDIIYLLLLELCFHRHDLLPIVLLVLDHGRRLDDVHVGL